MKKLAVFLITAIFMISIVPGYCMGDVIWQRDLTLAKKMRLQME